MMKMNQQVLARLATSWLLLHTWNFTDGLSCTDFLSPLELTTHGSQVDRITFPGPRTRNYDRNQVCEWRITAGDPEEIIQLEVEECSIQDRDIRGDCNQDYVNLFDIIDGDSVFIDRFCGTKVGMVYRSKGNAVIVRFHSDFSFEYHGFSLSYQAQQTEESSDGHDLTIKVAVGVPLAIIGIAMIVPCIFIVHATYKRRRREQRAEVPTSSRPESSLHLTQNQPAEQNSDVQQHTGPPIQRSFSNPSSRGIVGRGPPAWGLDTTTGQAYLSNNYSFNVEDDFDGRLSDFIHDSNLRVSLPSDHVSSYDDSEMAGGRRTPPPAYDSLDFEERLMTPPPYEAVVKDSEMGNSNSNDDSAC